MRGADGGPWRRICALPAFWVGLLYDDQALNDAIELTKDWSYEDVLGLRDQVPRDGLKSSIAGRSLLDVARDTLDIAKSGLKSRNILNAVGSDETHFLEPLQEVVARGTTPAEVKLALYHGRWNNSVDPIFDEFAY